MSVLQKEIPQDWYATAFTGMYDRSAQRIRK